MFKSLELVETPAKAVRCRLSRVLRLNGHAGRGGGACECRPNTGAVPSREIFTGKKRVLVDPGRKNTRARKKDSNNDLLYFCFVFLFKKNKNIYMYINPNQVSFSRLLQSVL